MPTIARQAQTSRKLRLLGDGAPPAVDPRAVAEANALRNEAHSLRRVLIFRAMFLAFSLVVFALATMIKFFARLIFFCIGCCFVY